MHMCVCVQYVDTYTHIKLRYNIISLSSVQHNDLILERELHSGSSRSSQAFKREQPHPYHHHLDYNLLRDPELVTLS